jgi:Protein kinase domain
MWSLGAVLFHVLCGSPPFTGRGDDRGAQMLRTIMTTDADYDILREEGVSEEGVDFVSRLLRTDPHERPNERELFKHPWISNVADLDEYSDAEDFPLEDEQLAMIQEALEEELDASQLSINDNRAYDEAAMHSGSDETLLKRPRLEEAEIIRYPSLPPMDSFPVFDVPPNLEIATASRLFGEVTSSAVRSSGVFGGLSPRDFSSKSDHSSGESMVDADDLSGGVHSFSVPDFEGSFPSLPGADSFMGQLKISISHENSFNSFAAADERPGTSYTHREREVTPANQVIPGAAQDELHANEITPKALPIHRRIELVLPDTASESSIPRIDDYQDHQNDDTDDHHQAELAVTIDARTGRALTEELPATTGSDNSHSPPPEINPKASGISRSLTPADFLKPRRVLGKLVTVPGSIIDLTLRLEGRMTSWGRGPLATVVYPERMDTRIPAYAIEVTFWSPGMEARIAEGSDWMDIPDVMTILSTKTRKCIWVNGVELRRGHQMENGSEAFDFGKLYTDDIITIFQNGDKYLHFRCEIYHGDSARPRPENEKGFIVRQVLQSKSDSNINRQPNSRIPDGDKLYA